jgi:membrane associated rhomboid family serine protease
MQDIGIVGLILVIINAIVSYQGLKDHHFFDKYSFRVDEILINKDYKRLITSGFLHVSWMHLFFNMVTLGCFSYALETVLGMQKFAIIYFASLIGGDLLSLFIHRNHGDYSSVGASGAISGIIFASIGVFPGMEIGFYGLPLYIPSWAYGLLYVLYSIYGIKSQKDNIGHEAHLGGGLIGLLVAIAMVPVALRENYLPILLIVIPSVIFIYLIIAKPEILLVNNLFEKSKGFRTLEDKYNSNIRNEEKELDSLLDKISKNGFDRLTSKEKEKLKELSDRR